MAEATHDAGKEAVKKVQFDAGDTAWTVDGRKVYVADRTVSGGYVVQEYLQDPQYADEWAPPIQFGAPFTIGVLHAEAPVVVYDVAVKVAQKLLADAREQLGVVNAEIREATSERTRLITKLSQVPALKHIELVLDGKLGWCVLQSGGGYLVYKLEDAIKDPDRYSHGKRLLTLFGDSKGDLQWQINSYRDGSGSWMKLWLCETEDEARALARQKTLIALAEAHDAYVEKKLAGTAKPANHDYWAIRRVVDAASNLMDLGGALPEEIGKNLTQIKLDAIDAEIAKIEHDARHYYRQTDELKKERAKIVAEEGDVPLKVSAPPISETH